jgi:ribosome-binding protein aMBF1 (putative translation factor)
MKKTTRVQNESSMHMKRSEIEKDYLSPGFVVTTTTAKELSCRVFDFETYAIPVAEISEEYTEIDTLINEFEKDPEHKAALEEARKWFTDSFHKEEGDTIRTLRMRRGWSQEHLAKILGTSQSHVARIERGTENILLDTFRKLASALEVDMGTLDRALRNQEAQNNKKII